MVWLRRYRDSFEFAKSCAAWLWLMRGTEFWRGIGQFIEEALAVSEEQDLPSTMASCRRRPRSA